MEPKRYMLWFFTVKIVCVDLMLYEWNISAMDIVRNAMVMPSPLLMILHAPFNPLANKIGGK